MVMTEWKIGDAKEQFSEVVRQAEREPQRIYNRDRFVAAVLDAETYAEFEQWRARQRASTLAARFSELQRIVAEEKYRLTLPRRRDRRTPFDDDPPR